MTDPTSTPTRRPSKTRRPHRAAGSRKVVLALSATATAAMMFTMASAKPAWTAEPTTDLAAADDAINVLSSRPGILLPVPPSADGTPVTTSVAPATPQPVQLTPVTAAPTVVTKTVVVKRKAKSSGSR